MGTTPNMALRYPEPTVLANTLHTQIKNLAEDVDAAAARKRQAFGGVQIVRDVVAGATDASAPRYVRINTTLSSVASLMPRIHIVGKTHSYQGAFDGHFTIYLYNTGGGTLYEPHWKSFGLSPVCYAGKNASNQLVIILDNAAGWNYGDVFVAEVANSFGTMVDAQTQNWTVTNTADLAGLTAVVQAT